MVELEDDEREEIMFDGGAHLQRLTDNIIQVIAGDDCRYRVITFLLESDAPIKIRSGKGRIYKVREPILGETMHCAICHGESGKVDQDWIDMVASQNVETRSKLYSSLYDVFLAYDGCEDHQEDIDERHI